MVADKTGLAIPNRCQRLISNHVIVLVPQLLGHRASFGNRVSKLKMTLTIDNHIFRRQTANVDAGAAIHLIRALNQQHFFIMLCQKLSQRLTSLTKANYHVFKFFHCRSSFRQFKIIDVSLTINK